MDCEESEHATKMKEKNKTKTRFLDILKLKKKD